MDVTAAGSGNSATSSSGAVTTTNRHRSALRRQLVQTQTTGPGSGFTSRLLTSPDGDIAEDQMVTAIGSYSATAPLSSGQWIMQMVAFRTPVTCSSDAAHGARQSHGDRGQCQPDQPELDCIDQLFWDSALRGAALPGGRLHELCHRLGLQQAPPSAIPVLSANTSYSYQVQAVDNNAKL